MIGRLWKTGLKAGRGSAYEAFAREISLPMFRAQEGFLGCVMSRDEETGLVMTFWKDENAVKTLNGSPSYNETVAKILAADVLTTKQTITVGMVHLLDLGHIPFSDGYGRAGSDGNPERDGLKIEQRIAESYDAVARDYAANVVGVERKPLDLAFLDQFVRMLDGRGPVWDIGCGPGDVTRHLHDRGVDVCGVDLSPAMIAEARHAHPGIAFSVGDLANLDAAASSLAGIVAFYSLIHLPPHEIQSVLHDFGRYLQRDGLLLIALHAGEGVNEVQEWFGKPVSLHGYFFQPAQLMNMLQQAGFVVVSSLSRPPYPEIEFSSQRVYLLARSSA
jgi:SAM-dependent methyltransferase/heme-degrading monooxygenase HmoA